MIKNFVFDVDGTLINTETAYMNALLTVLNKKHGLGFTYEQVVQIYGITGEDGLNYLGIKSENIPTLMKEWNDEFTGLTKTINVFPEIKGLIKSLKTYPVSIGIVTSKSIRGLKKDLLPFELLNEFDNIVTSSDTKLHKPAPDPILKMIEFSGVSAQETLYLGDTIYDMKAAKSAGSLFGLAGWGAHNLDRFTDADYVFERPSDVLRVVQSLSQKS